MMVSNPILNTKYFKTDKGCNPEIRQNVEKNGRIFLIFLLLSLGLSGLCISALIYGAETTLVFKTTGFLSDITGQPIFEVPENDMFIKFNETTGNPIYLTDANISHGAVQLIGFLIVDYETLVLLQDNIQYYTQLIGIAHFKIQSIIETGESVSFSEILDLPLIDEIRNHSIAVVTGNFFSELSQVVKFKITTSKYIIPICQIYLYSRIPYTLASYYKYELVGGLQISLFEPEELQTKGGVWEFSIREFYYDYQSNYYYHSNAYANITDSMLPPVTFDGTITRSFSLKYLFESVKYYSTIEDQSLITL